MVSGNSRAISTNQQGVHDKLDELVKRYQSSATRRPVSQHTQAAFDEVNDWLHGFDGPVVLDSCCGVGESTAKLAVKYPHARVIGIDKSEARLDKHATYASDADNYRVIRADVNDFWRLVAQSQWQVEKHYLLYPNPYPKSSQVQKRWHASDAMPALMATSNAFEVRSNWLVYVMEFAQAARHYGLASALREVDTAHTFTPFERKYTQSGQTCWQLTLASEEAE
ncbi:tRNA (guanine(46)-N(7))-methyltransferase TrmB [Alteromonas sp. CYL-A6]|uniref:tRNA (guanine(46)-N(7))-methyltransferase TrmB n=1 Tax=Alteromonas nitratireducens TaxID=3390813 RepID=UPI0034C2EE27